MRILLLNFVNAFDWIAFLIPDKILSVPVNGVWAGIIWH